MDEARPASCPLTNFSCWHEPGHQESNELCGARREATQCKQANSLHLAIAPAYLAELCLAFICRAPMCRDPIKSQNCASWMVALMQKAAARQHMQNLHHRPATAPCVPYQALPRQLLRALDGVSWRDFRQSLGAAGPKPQGHTSSVLASLGLAYNEGNPPKVAFPDHVAPSRASATYALPTSPGCGTPRPGILVGRAPR